MLKETLFCTNCDKEKPLEEFSFRNKKKGIRHKKCKECQAAYHRKHYQANKKYYGKKARRWDAENRDIARRFVIAYLREHPCVDCGETDPLVLDFDHVRGKKSYNISDMIRLIFSIDEIKKEIAKCDVRCANCHRIKTAKEEGWHLLDLLEEYERKNADGGSYV